MKKRLLSLALCLCMALSLLPVSAFAEELPPTQGLPTDEETPKTDVLTDPVTNAPTTYTLSGEGTSASPYQIGTVAELYAFADIVNGTNGATAQRSACAVLTDDIVINVNVLGTEDKTGFTQWTPIGIRKNAYYMGTFDGQGHTISGLYYDGGDPYAGLFGFVDGLKAENPAYVRNVGIVDSYINSTYAGADTATGLGAGIGGVVGYLGMNGVISDCYNEGTISGTGRDSAVGGVLGRNCGTLFHSYNIGTVRGAEYVGGIVGYNHKMTTVTAGIDGMLGADGSTPDGTGDPSGTGTIKHYPALGRIEYCYNSGTAEGGTHTGGIVGFNGCIVMSCYSTTENIAGTNTGYVKNSYATSTPGTTDFASGRATWLLNGGEIQDAAPQWKQEIDTDPYPVLTGTSNVYAQYDSGCSIISYSNQPTDPPKHSYDADGICTVCNGYQKPEAGAGTAEDPFEIKTIGNLYWLAWQTNADNSDHSAKLVQDLSFDPSVLAEDGTLNDTPPARTWTPIGTTNSPYTGNFDGQGHTISGLYVNDRNMSYVGLFGASKGNISNVVIKDSYFCAQNYMGSVCGSAMGGRITKCESAATVIGEVPSSGDSYIGGLVGIMSRGTMSNCLFTGHVGSSADNQGSKQYIGGLAGYISSSNAKIDSCLNVGKVTGQNQLAGAVVAKRFNGVITNCYYSESCGAGLVTVGSTPNVTATEAAALTDGQLASGEAAYRLNKNTSAGTPAWYQNLDTQDGDAHPVLTSTGSNTVYKLGDGTYSNVNASKTTVTITGLSAATGLVYTGSAQTGYTGAAVCKNGETDVTADCGALVYTYYKSTGASTWGDGSTTQPTNAGSYKLVVSVDGNNMTYTGTSEEILFTVGAKPVTVAAGTYVVSKAYDGTATTGKASGALAVSGILSADSGVNVKATPVAYTNVNAGKQTSMDVTISLRGDTNGNYTLGNVSSVAVPCSITQAPLTVSDYTPANKNYDGSTAATVSAVTFVDLQSSEVLAPGADYTTSAQFVNKNAATGVAVSGTVTLTDSDKAKNYSLASGELSGRTADIAPVAPTYSVADQSITIGKTLAEIQAAQAATGVGGESVVGALTWSETNGGAALTDYIFSGAVGATKTLYWTFTPGDSNYQALSGTAVFTLIDKEVPVLTVANIEKTYDGAAVTTVSGAATVGGVNVAGSFAFEGAGEMKNAGTYSVTVKFTPEDAEKYAVATTGITVSIGKATITVKADDKSAYVGDAQPALTYTVTGLVGGETLKTVPTLACASDMSKAGSYPITASGAEAPDGGNYHDITYTPGTLTVSAKSTSGDGGGGAVTPPAGDTVTNPDGSTTTTVVDKTTGTVTETTKNPDGSAQQVVTAEQKQPDGSTVKAETTVTTDKNGKTTAAAATVATDSASGVVKVPTAVIETLSKAPDATLSIEIPKASLTLDGAALQALAAKGGKAPQVSIAPAAADKLPQAAQEKLKDAAVYSFNVNGGGMDFGGGTVTVSLDYARKNSNTVVSVYFVNDKGEMTKIPGSSFKNGKVTFPTGHFSYYAIREEAMPFTDVSVDSYYADAVLWAADKGITGGTSATTFSPDATCTRAQAVTFLWRAMGSPAPATTNDPFTDVSADSYYYNAVLWAVEQGITGGTSATTFSPDAIVSRAQVVTFLHRAAKSPVVDYLMGFSDVAASAYYAEAVRWAVSEGVTGGTSATTFGPDATCTRAQIVTFLYRAMGK